MTTAVQCRFCGSSVSVNLPPGEFAGQVAKMVLNRGCCEGCKEYQSERSRRVDTIAMLAVEFGRSKPGEMREKIRGALGTVVGKLCGSAAVHHAKPLGEHASELLEAIYADPFGARELCEMFEKGCK